MRQLPLIALVLIVSACGPSHVSRSVEVDSSLATTEWLDNEIGFVRDRNIHNYLNNLLVELSRSIYKAALETELHRVVTKDYSAYPWQVFLLKTDRVNAFSSGAGALYITEGLLDTLQTEAELAAVLCHEMAHQLLEHPRAALTKTGAGLVSPALSFSLEQELDADRLGVQMLKVSGYDPRAALSALNYGYRRGDGSVSVRDKNLDLRIAFILTNLADEGRLGITSRNNSREFTRLKNYLK